MSTSETASQHLSGEDLALVTAEPSQPSASPETASPAVPSAEAISELRSTIAQRHRSAMSPVLVLDDAAARRQRDVENLATNATATGKRRDLLAYLRLRRSKRN